MTRCHLPLTRAPFSGTAMKITIKGLLGGHSGVEIDKGRANANMLMGRLLYAAQTKTPLRLVSVAGGNKDNAIPRESQALLLAENADTLRTVVAEMAAAFQREYRSTDPGVSVTVEDASTDKLPMDEASTFKAITLLTCMPDGVQVMSPDIAGLVQTSLNLGILTTEEKELQASFCIRSSVATQKQMLVNRIACLMQLMGGSIDISGDYPAWEYKKDSALRDLMVEVFRKQYGRDPQISAIHAGLECGMFAGKLPDLDCVSIGPDMSEVHTYHESLSISSVQRVWDFLVEVLRCAK